MNDDYLWDRTGEPDPEIARLEQVLGTLRCQPQLLEIPVQLQGAHRRSHFPSLAIAAAIVMTIFAVGLWAALHRREPVQVAAAPSIALITESKPRPATSPELTKGNDEIAIATAHEDKTIQPHTQLHRRVGSVSNNTSLARNNARDASGATKQSALTADEKIEAQAAKEQLFLALRVASSKLSLAQKRAQGTYPTNQIRNQHKVG
ncbi:MAG: hypothetical protein ABJB97_12240 [Acidobacteriota bacterium]